MALISNATKSEEGTVKDHAASRMKYLTRPWRDAAGPDVGVMSMTRTMVVQLSSGDALMVAMGPGAEYTPVRKWDELDWDDRKEAAIEYLNDGGDARWYPDRLAMRTVLPWVRLHQRRRATDDRPSYKRLYAAMMHVLDGGDMTTFADPEALAFVLPVFAEAA